MCKSFAFSYFCGCWHSRRRPTSCLAIFTFGIWQCCFQRGSANILRSLLTYRRVDCLHDASIFSASIYLPYLHRIDMSLNTLPLCVCEATVSQRHSRSFNFLKGLVHRPCVKSLSPARPENVGSALDAFHKPGPNGQACTVCAKCSPRPHSWDVSTPWKRRDRTPGMDDYLTFAQLEECLDRQSFYIGCIEIPHQVTQSSFTETAEVPLIAKHSLDTRPTQSYQEELEPRIQLSHLANQTSPATIAGLTHPAFRESALRPIPSIVVDRELPPVEPQSKSDRLAVPVPTTNWTYGR